MLDAFAKVKECAVLLYLTDTAESTDLCEQRWKGGLILFIGPLTGMKSLGVMPNAFLSYGAQVTATAWIGLLLSELAPGTSLQWSLLGWISVTISTWGYP